MKIQNSIPLAPPTPEARAAKNDEALKGAAKQYEKYFMNEMVKAMRSTVGNNDDGVVKTNFAEKLFTEQLDNQYVDNWSEKGGVGLADIIYSQIKERYYGTGQPALHPGHMMLPIAPKNHPLAVPSTDSIQMKALPPAGGAKLSYRFEVPATSGGGYEVKAPMAGRVADLQRLDQDWNLVRLDHGQGLTSELTFPGPAPQIAVGQAVEPGQRLGQVHPDRPVVAWNLEWT
jgi:flagellar protein FlgJ